MTPFSKRFLMDSGLNWRLDKSICDVCSPNFGGGEMWEMFSELEVKPVDPT